METSEHLLRERQDALLAAGGSLIFMAGSFLAVFQFLAVALVAEVKLRYNNRFAKRS